ncbi:nucleoside-diphosphate kinase [Streptomyces sp. NPDC093510]|uniref:nucleoside-diphosphate kinase n=1 Tax=Streptomyces sp. NPDC093510 TaxID=3155199 RepID=UPI00342BD3FF
MHHLMQGNSRQALTEDPDKLDAFIGDPDFEQGYAYGHEVLGTELGAALRRHALLLIQPDCLARRQAMECVVAAEQHGFQLVTSVRVHLSPRVVGALWFYQEDSSTPDSCTIGELVCGHTDSLLLLLRDEAPLPDTPASLRMTRLKGPSRPEQRTAEHLRSAIGAQDRLVVLIHTSDEPADMIRESAIICGSSARELYQKMAEPVADDARSQLTAQIESLYEQTEPHDLEPQAALTRLGEALSNRATDPQYELVARGLLSTLTSVQAGEHHLDWQPFARDLAAVGIDPTQWDPVLVGSRYIKVDTSDRPRRFAVTHNGPAQP